jgi:hypothetical protein
MRDRERMPGRFGVRNEDVKLDEVGLCEARRGREVDAGVADRGCDLRERPRLVLDLDDKVERNRRTLSNRRRSRHTTAAP